MLKGIRGWWKLVLVAVCMIGFIIFGGHYAFAEESPCVSEQSCLNTEDKQPQPQQIPCLSDEPPCFSETKPLKKQPKATCFPGQPCTPNPSLGNQKPTPPRPVPVSPTVPSTKIVIQ